MSCRRIVSLLLAVAFGFGVSGQVFAYSVMLHDRLPDVLAKDPALGVSETASLPDEAGLEKFRLRLYALFSETGDAALRARFLARYPDAASFSTVAFKEFLGSAAMMPTLGFDPYADVHAAASRSVELPAHYSAVLPGEERTLLEWVRIGSAYPDLDGRNQNRWWLVDGGFPKTRDGEKIPFDPVILNMGRVEGLSGQAHAHYGLNDRPKSEDPAVLKSTPADFAVAVGFDGPVLTFAPERAQAYGDLAILARHLGEPALAALFAGNGFHYLGDLGNQIHTIQVGIYKFFVDATLQVWKMKLVCLWGLRCDPPGLTDIGLDIISNHHLWLEEYFRIAVEAAIAEKPVHPALSSADDLFSSDEATHREWSRLPVEGPLMHELAQRLIAYGNVEGPQVYALARALTRGELRKAGVSINFSEKPDAVTLDYLKPGADQGQLAAFLGLQAMGVRRAATAMEIWWRAALAPEAAPDWRTSADRLLLQQLDELDAVELRRAQWIEQRGGVAEGVQLLVVEEPLP
jgi:hypothetical protein